MREEPHLFDDQFRMILKVPEGYHPLIEDKVKQEEDEVWFDKLGEHVCTFKYKLHNWLKQGKSHLKENPGNHHLERNHTHIDLHQNPARHNLATHQPRKEPQLKGFELQN